MRVLKVFPIDVSLTCEFRLSEIKKLLTVLDNCTITVSADIEGSFEARDFVVDELHPELKRLIKDFDDGS